MGSSEQLPIAKVTLRDQACSVGSGLYPPWHPETIQSHGEDAASWCLPCWDLLPTEACGSWVERSYVESRGALRRLRQEVCHGLEASLCQIDKILS